MAKGAKGEAGGEEKVVKKVKVIAEVVKVDPRKKKAEYFERLTGYLKKYSKAMIISIDNVGAKHLSNIRKQFRGQAEILMGKNTMMRKCINRYIEDEKHPELQALSDALVGNVGLVFTNGDMASIRKEMIKERIPAPAKAGIIAPSAVVIPAGPTGLEPTATAFLQALNIASKIVKGQVELTSQVRLIEKGSKVKPGAVVLLSKLNITPFTYGINVDLVYNNGFLYPAELLDITDREVLQRFGTGLSHVAALGYAIGIPTIATVPHTIAKTYQNLLAIGVQTNYSFGPVDELKAKIANPSAFASAPAASSGGAAPAAAAVEAPAESSEEEMELDLFG